MLGYKDRGLGRYYNISLDFHGMSGWHINKVEVIDAHGCLFHQFPFPSVQSRTEGLAHSLHSLKNIEEL